MDLPDSTWKRFPSVEQAVALVTTDRSADSYRILAAAFDASLLRLEAYAAVLSRKDLSERLAERSDNDLDRMWLKIVDDRHNERWFDAVGRQAAAAVGDDDGESSIDPLEGAIQHRLTVLRVNREAQRRLDDEERPHVEPPPVKSLDELLAEPDSPTPYLIEGLAPTDARVVLAAKWKTGKTTVVGNVTRSRVDRDPFLGRFAVNVPAHHLALIDDELGENMRRKWLREQGIKNTGAVADVIGLRGKVASFNLFDDRCRSYWARRLSDVGCDYLVLDCLGPILQAFDLDENRDAGKFLVQFDALLDEAGIRDALIVHHMGHANERARGGSALQDWPDATWYLVRETDAPSSPRYFSAFGRDVDVPEGRLTYDPATRRLTYVGESRSDAKTEAAYSAVIRLLADREARGVRTIQEALSDEHTQNAVRAAVKKGVGLGVLSVEPGAHRAKLHSIAYPCAQCGLPVTSQRERHESCPTRPDGLDE